MCIRDRYLDGNILDPAALAVEANVRRKAGFEVEYIGPAEVERRYGISRRHAIVGYGNYSADPRRLAAVSYTHLDVYKRQIPGSVSVALNAAMIATIRKMLKKSATFA